MELKAQQGIRNLKAARKEHRNQATFYLMLMAVPLLAFLTLLFLHGFVWNTPYYKEAFIAVAIAIPFPIAAVVGVYSRPSLKRARDITEQIKTLQSKLKPTYIKLHTIYKYKR